MEKKLQKYVSISFKLKFINSGRFMVSSLSNLVDNLAEGIHTIKCTNCKTCCLEYTHLKDGLIEFKCLYCYKISKKNLCKLTNIKNLSIHINLLTKISVSLFRCCEKVFTI